MSQISLEFFIERVDVIGWFCEYPEAEEWVGKRSRYFIPCRLIERGEYFFRRVCKVDKPGLFRLQTKTRKIELIVAYYFEPSVPAALCRAHSFFVIKNDARRTETKLVVLEHNTPLVQKK